MSFEKLCDLLKRNNFKLTDQRKSILFTLYENKDSLMSPEDLLIAAKKNSTKINLSTIYRNIDALLKFDLLYKHIKDNGSTLYKLKLKDSHSHHMICTKCGKTETVEFCPIEAFKGIIDKKQFKLKEHKLELYGHCKECNDEKNRG
ncbi:Fur family transcriptional regulator [Oceanirhabdus sp. W0125-5]|uniref:Fur family transcriptional regulator n=1 Tax=Oceanirhabdus sp. W0125-5 TaxID=2999116 RepID=UPI0022F2DC15|nr:Fur family transcriptional regulator [Oceanirhabdus sp. W0125-5]WBW97361.1 Fur family transcriptional regulator [Oceanirhabdus sp. W0125-5]